MASAIVFALFYGLTPLVVVAVAYYVLLRERSEESEAE